MHSTKSLLHMCQIYIRYLTQIHTDLNIVFKFTTHLHSGKTVAYTLDYMHTSYLHG